MNITESFIFGIIGLAFGGLSMLLAKIFRFKCSSISCLGVSCIRNIDLENQAYEYEIEHNNLNADVIPRRHSF
jgi:hypothetical protein